MYFSLAITFGAINVQQQESWLAMLRFTGRWGIYKDFDVIRDNLRKVPRLVASEARILEDGSLAITDGRSAIGIFDPTYRPLKAVIAKWQVIDLMQRNGPNATYKYTEITGHLRDMLDDYFMNLRTNVITDDSRISFKMELNTTFRLNAQGEKGEFSQNVIARSKSIEQSIGEELLAHPFPQGQGRGKAERHGNPWTGEVNLYVEDRTNYGFHAAAERKLIEIFDHWALKEHSNLDNRIVNYLELGQQLNPLATVLRSKTFDEFKQLSPTGYTEILSDIVKRTAEKQSIGADELRSSLASSPVYSSGRFSVSFVLAPSKKPKDFPFLAGTVSK